MRAKGLSLWLAALLCLCGVVPGAEGFSVYVLEALRSMPRARGYASDRDAERRLAERGIVWGEQGLRISPEGASPTFCSAACYMVLLRALKSWESARRGGPFPPEVWRSLRVEPRHPDGYLSWGRANANGPGFAKWVADLGAGENFCDVDKACPGDFLKFFHTEEIGSAERGHMVIYLGRSEGSKGAEPSIRYWSCNQREGYGVRSIPLGRMRHPIFTRILRPEAFSRAASLPAWDAWLSSMQTQPHSYREVKARCRLRD